MHHCLDDDEVLEQPDNDLGEVFLGAVVAGICHDLRDAGVYGKYREVRRQFLAYKLNKPD